MRGKATTDGKQYDTRRITPAHAGKSRYLYYRKYNERDHPRTCGEKTFCLNAFCLSTGSPPHMRGKVSLVDFIRSRLGITPAHAGKRSTQSEIVKCGGDHPRTCGEKDTFGTYSRIRPGSPPHMRGKAGNKIRKTSRTWITPAHAGKSYIEKQMIKEGRDHPRTCGEKIL